jgi:uncharacterized cofD-like protein
VQPKVGALGGGHGLAATLTALRKVTSAITAIVTVSDNGGSSGRLRKEFSIFPPGDLRMALAALCGDDEWGRSWADIMQYRFTSDGALNGHPVGNLLLAALWDRDEDPVAGLDRVASLLKVVGRVLPMASEPLDTEATFFTPVGRVVIRGQAQVAVAKGKLDSLRILPENPVARPEALDAIAAAEWITMGPGSWFSSVLPHLLVPAQRQALVDTSAKKIVILNLDAHADWPGEEYAGHAPEEHLGLIGRYAPEMPCNFVIADTTVVKDVRFLTTLVAKMGGELVVADLREAPGSVHHNVEKLTSVFHHIMTNTLIG